MCDFEQGVCIEAPSPCLGACSPEKQECVECISTQDCVNDGLICDTNVQRCIPCTDSTQCPHVGWCRGGQQMCDYDGTCVDPLTKPCSEGQQDTCVDEFRQCFKCTQNADCGPTEFCENQLRCDVATGQCHDHQSECAQRQLRCDSVNNRCVGCLMDADCIDPLAPFCASPIHCDMESGNCVSDTSRPTPCDDVNEACDEKRKTCVKTFHAVPTVPGVETSSDGGTVSLPRTEPKDAPISCTLQNDCTALGLVCKIVSPVNGALRECRPCDNDAQCTDGNPLNGDEICDKTTGKCLPPQEVSMTGQQAASSVAHLLPGVTNAPPPTGGSGGGGGGGGNGTVSANAVGTPGGIGIVIAVLVCIAVIITVIILAIQMNRKDVSRHSKRG